MATKTVTLEIPDHEAARYEAAIRDGLGEIDRILKRLNRKQARIDKLKAQTRAVLDRLKEK